MIGPDLFDNDRIWPTNTQGLNISVYTDLINWVQGLYHTYVMDQVLSTALWPKHVAQINQL